MGTMNNSYNIILWYSLHMFQFESELYIIEFTIISRTNLRIFSSLLNYSELHFYNYYVQGGNISDSELLSRK